MSDEHKNDEVQRLLDAEASPGVPAAARDEEGDAASARVQRAEAEIDAVEARLEEASAALDAVEASAEEVETRLDEVEVEAEMDDAVDEAHLDEAVDAAMDDADAEDAASAAKEAASAPKRAASAPRRARGSAHEAGLDDADVALDDADALALDAGVAQLVTGGAPGDVDAQADDMASREPATGVTSTFGVSPDDDPDDADLDDADLDDGDDDDAGDGLLPAAHDEVAAARAALDDPSRVLRLSEHGDGVWVITFDVPGAKQNTLQARFAEEFAELLDALSSQGDVRGVVLISGKPDTFVAGADISMIQAASSAEEAQALSAQSQAGMQRLSELPFPVVAAIHGACLGGGLELALACHARVCSDSAKTVMALPEVQLGLLPGAGGTQRLPRLIGIQAALDMMLTGRRVRPRRARRLGLVDEVVARPILLEAAVERARAMAAQDAPAPSPLDRLGQALRALTKPAKLQKMLLEDNPIGRMVLFQQARKQLLGKTLGNYPAPERIIEAVQVGVDQGFAAGLEAEARHFGALAVSPEARQLIGIFFATTALKKDRGVDDEGVEPIALSHVGVLGAGLMGAGVAFVTVERAGLPVRLKDRDEAGVSRGLAAVDGLLKQRVRRRALTRAAAGRKLRSVTGTTDLSGFAGCEVVIEAVFEDLELKHRMLGEVEAVAGPQVIFASNTSSIPIREIAAASAHPETVIGMHYFSPVEKMPLLEVIVTEQTAPWVTATCVALGKRQGKTVIVVRDGVGFYTSRILAPYMNEAARLLAEGVPIDHIDGALKRWGFPVGPITLLDEVGVDVAAKVGPIMIAAFGERMEPPGTFERLLADGRLGRKAKKGFYTYGGGRKQKKAVDASVYEVLGLTPDNEMDPTLVAERCALLMVNEAALCLEEGILRSPRDGDIGAVFGLGFPPFRGGPFRYVDAEGAAEVVRKLERLTEQLGPRFTPAASLVERARAGGAFYSAQG